VNEPGLNTDGSDARPIFWAVSARQAPALKLLLDSKASADVAQHDGSGPLAISSEVGDDQLVAVLCSALGVGHPEVNRAFGEGERVTPLWLACKDASSPEARGEDATPTGRDRDGQVGLTPSLALTLAPALALTLTLTLAGRPNPIPGPNPSPSPSPSPSPNPNLTEARGEHMRAAVERMAECERRAKLVLAREVDLVWVVSSG